MASGQLIADLVRLAVLALLFALHLCEVRGLHHGLPKLTPNLILCQTLLLRQIHDLSKVVLISN
jgi:hypothetical protein